MRALPPLLLAIAAGAAILILLPAATAQTASSGTCSQAKTTILGFASDYRAWTVLPNAESNPGSGPPVSCTFGSSIATVYDVNAGASLVLKCDEQSIGATPPGAATSITVKGFPDNDNFNSPTSTAIWTWNVGTSCATHPTFTMWCTSDGTSTGALRYGIIRINVHPAKTTVPTYDVNSEDANGAVGIVRCDPRPTSMQPANTPSGSNVWIGGNTYDATVTLNSAAYGASPGNTGNLRATCNNQESSPTSFQLGTSASTQNNALTGTPNAWQTGCTMKHNATLTKTSSISLYSGTDFARWDQSSPISGVTFPSNKVATYTSRTLTRTLTAGLSCTTGLDPVNRGNTETTSACGWQDANGVQVPNNHNAEGWYQRAGQWESWDDFPSANGTFGSSGSFSTSLAAKNAGCASQANAPAAAGACATATTGHAYHKLVQTCSASCTAGDANLENWGNTTGLFDVSSRWTFDGIHDSKTPGGANVSSFTGGTDTQYLQALGLRDANSALLSGKSVSCARTNPNSVMEPSTSMGSTDASGNSPEVNFDIKVPGGAWTVTCTSFEGGNTATYTITFNVVASFTGNIQSPVLFNVTYNATASIENGSARFDVNVTAGLREYDQLSDEIVNLTPDQPPRLTVLRYQAGVDEYSYLLVRKATMRQEDAGRTYDYKFTVDLTALQRGMVAHATFNLSSAPFLASGMWRMNDCLLTLCVDSAYANATFEGQPHANATWCPLSCGGSGMVPGGFVANTWYNATACQQNGTACYGSFHGDGGNLTNVTDAAACHQNATACYGSFHGDGANLTNIATQFTTQEKNDVISTLATVSGPAWTMLPYFVILLAAFVMVILGATKLPPGFGLIGSVVAIILAFASLADANASSLLKTFLFVAAFAMLLATLAIKRRSSSYT